MIRTADSHYVTVVDEPTNAVGMLLHDYLLAHGSWLLTHHSPSVVAGMLVEIGAERAAQLGLIEFPLPLWVVIEIERQESAK